MHRLFNPLNLKSFFLFGARGTGKTWLLRELFKNAEPLILDLLNGRDFDRYSQNPALLSETISTLGTGDRWVIIDEVQKVPPLLDMVHLEIEAHSRSKMGITNERPNDRNILFALTGSSARKLRRGKANLLAGRALLNYLYPLTTAELPEMYPLSEILEWGTLPRVVTLQTPDEKREYLLSYVNAYLREEILEEQLARSAPPFRKFLEIAAQMNGQIVNYSKIANDVGLSPPTIINYFQILEDTLLAHKIEPFHLSIRKRQRQAPKYYFFDLGIQRALARSLGHALPPANYGFGRAFEHFVVCEIIRLASYRQLHWEFSYFMSGGNVEIDLIIERSYNDRVLIEIKSKERLDESDVRALLQVRGDIEHAEAFVFSLDKVPRVIDGVRALPWREGLRALGLV